MAYPDAFPPIDRFRRQFAADFSVANSLDFANLRWSPRELSTFQFGTLFFLNVINTVNFNLPRLLLPLRRESDFCREVYFSARILLQLKVRD